MKICAWFAAAALLAFPVQAATARTAKAGSAHRRPASQGVASKTAVSSSDVTVERDLVYATRSGFRPLTLDLYRPRGKARDLPRPALIFVHGGNWDGGDFRHATGYDDFPAVLTGLARHGYVVASIAYRLSGEAHFPAAIQDVKTAIGWLRQHAADYGIDSTRLAIWGEDAGGQLAALAGTSCGVAALEPSAPIGDKPPSDCVQAVIAWNAFSDLGKLADDRGSSSGAAPEAAYLGCEPAACPPGVVRLANPVTFVGANTPPFLIQVNGGRAVPPAQPQRIYDALTAAHVPVTLVSFAKADPDAGSKALAALTDFLDKTFPRSAPATRTRHAN